MGDDVATPEPSQLNQFSKAISGSKPGPHIPPLPPKPRLPPLTEDDVPADLLTLSDDDFAEFVRRCRKSPAPFKFPEIFDNPVRSVKKSSWERIEKKLAEKLTEKVGPGPREWVKIGGRDGVPIRDVSTRVCTELPKGLFLKSGMSHPVEEAGNLKVAHSMGLPSPRFHRLCLYPQALLMENIEGDRLSDLWPDMTPEQKKDIALQLRSVISQMRTATPPPSQGIGTGGGGQARELRPWFDYSGGPFKTELEFNNEFIFKYTGLPPPAMDKAMRAALRSDHRIVFTHSDLKTHNILVKDGRLVGLIDWEFAGWLPEYWEFVQFVRGWHTEETADFVNFAEDIFESQYPEELVAWCAISRWRHN